MPGQRRTGGKLTTSIAADSDDLQVVGRLSIGGEPTTDSRPWTLVAVGMWPPMKARRPCDQYTRAWATLILLVRVAARVHRWRPRPAGQHPLDRPQRHRVTARDGDLDRRSRPRPLRSREVSCRYQDVWSIKMPNRLGHNGNPKQTPL